MKSLPLLTALLVLTGCFFAIPAGAVFRSAPLARQEAVMVQAGPGVSHDHFIRKDRRPLLQRATHLLQRLRIPAELRDKLGVVSFFSGLFGIVAVILLIASGSAAFIGAVAALGLVALVAGIIGRKGKEKGLAKFGRVLGIIELGIVALVLLAVLSYA